MRSSLEGVEGVGKIDIAAGNADFTVHFDSKKIKADAICEAIKKKEAGAKIKT
ncbi:MAG: copper chaperone CopZ [Neolewinella sp.]